MYPVTSIVKYKLYDIYGSSKAIPSRTKRRWRKNKKTKTLLNSVAIESSNFMANEQEISVMDRDYLDQTMPETEYCEKSFDYQDLEENELQFSNPEFEESAYEEIEDNNFEIKLDSIADFIDYNNDFDIDDCIYNNNNNNYYNIHDYQDDYYNNSITDIINGHGDNTIVESNDSDEESPSQAEECVFSPEILVNTLLLMATKLKRNFSYTDNETVMKLLDLFNDSTSTHVSKYIWKRILYKYSNFLIIYHFCIYCHRFIGPQASIPKKEDLLYCKDCREHFNVKENLAKRNIFIYLPLKHQLSQFCQNHYNLLKNPANRPKSFKINDIYDGKLYQNEANDMLSISFSLDGAPIFKSSNCSIYPLLCSLNEIPPLQRQKNIMLVSLWFGKGKIKYVDGFLKPFIDECKELYETGFTYVHDGIVLTQKCRVLNCVCDSVQRPIMRGTKQFNGEYGCGLCLHKGESITKGKGHTRVYPVLENNNFYGEGLRNHDDTLIHARENQYGVKRKTLLADIPEFDIINNIDVDWMHCVALGVCRQFADMWFSSSNSKKKFYCGALLTEVDKILASFKPSLEISRTPRKMSDRAHWKAHEWVVWLLFYSLPIMKILFPPNLTEHWSLLVEAVALLCKSSIMPSEMYRAENLLFTFIKETEVIYGKEYMSFNVHLLSHLAPSVRNWGPLYTHSAFIYENYNQFLKNCVQSSNGVAVQVTDTVRMKIALENLEHECADYLTENQQQFLDNLFNRSEQFKDKFLVNDNIELIGPIVRPPKCLKHIKLICKNELKKTKNNVKFYDRAKIKNEMIHSRNYSKKRVKKRNSYTVLLKNDKIFEIEVFMTLTDPQTNLFTTLAIGRYYKDKNKGLIKNRQLDHLILLAKEPGNLTKVRIEEIKEKITLLDYKKWNELVACIHLNHYELLT